MIQDFWFIPAGMIVMIIIGVALFGKKPVKLLEATKKKVDKIYCIDKLRFIGLEYWGLYYEGKKVDRTLHVKTITDGLIAVDGEYYLQVFAESNEEAVTYYCEKFYNYIRS